jgi:DNA repair protein RAD5
MTDCPERLIIGVTLFVTLHVFILPAAFKLPTIPKSEEASNTMFNEGQETLDEK